MAIIKIRNAAIDLDAAEIPNLDASKITTGSFATARITDDAITNAKIANDSITINGSSVALGASTTIATGTDWQSVQTSNFTAAVGKGYPINTTGGAITCTFPSSASAGDTIVLMDYARKFGTNALTINQNSVKFQGNTSPNPQYSVDGQTITCTYIDSTQGWIPTSDDNVTFETQQTYNATYLCVAGAGGGGHHKSGGGGAGGLLTGTFALSPSTVYTITVGSGGNGSGSSSNPGSQGQNSVISGSGLTTVTSIGGGGGGSDGNNSSQLDGGSGGGAGGGGNTSSPGSGTSGQGNDGGNGVGGSQAGGGGGGGSGSAGVNAAGTTAGNGGDGTANSITGSSVAYAGGGGGAHETGGSTQGTGISGGGNGAKDGNGGNGTDGLGSGGGGSHNSTGGNGGDGVVILSVPDANYSGTTTGNPTVNTNVSGNTIIKFTGSGSYTA